MKKTANTLLLTCLVFFSLGAQSPYLDQTFGVNGRFTHHFFPQSTSRLWCTAPQADGKIVGAGMTYINDYYRAAALRCLPNGTLDTTFANHGEWISDDPFFDIVSNIIIQPDGKILLSGNCYGNLKVVRLMPDGNYDTSFGIGGTANVTIWPGAGEVYVYGMELLSNGRIVILTTSDATPAPEFALTRLRENGAVDGSFGTFGIVKLNLAAFNGSIDQEPRMTTVMSDSKIIVAGRAKNDGILKTFILRFNANGTIDSEFGENGIRYNPLTYIGINQIWVLPDNSLQVLGFAWDGPAKVALIKYHPDGTIDSTFAVNGVGTLSHNNLHSGAYSSALQADGKVVVFGGTFSGRGFLGRFNADGSPDLSFGSNGTIGPESLVEVFYHGFVQPDGNIVTVTRYWEDDHINLCSILRYLGSHSVGAIETAEPLGAAWVYPNPVSGGILQIAYELPEAAPVHIELLDMQGKQLSRLMYADRPSGHSEEMLVLPAGLMPGHYLLNIRSNKGNRVIRVVVR